MPTSDYTHIPAVLDYICAMNPMPISIFEIGVGFGKWGVLLREILDARYGRVNRFRWHADIYGVEVFQDYRNPAWDVYTLVTVGDGLHGDICGNDVVMMMDVLEHFEPQIGMTLLRKLVRWNSRVIVSVPNGPMPQGEVFGNPHEAHLTTFLGHEFDEFEHVVLHKGLCLVVAITGRK